MSDNKIHLPDLHKGRFWNKGPMVVTGCTKVSEGCDNCWSETAHAMRLSNLDVNHIYSPELMTAGKFNGKVQFNLRLLEKACKTRKPQVIAIWNDLYHKGVTLDQVASAHEIMGNPLNRHHVFLIVTKRPERAAGFCQGVHDMTGAVLPPNIYHIVTMENQARIDERMPHLLNIPGNRAIIIEPMIGPVRLTDPYLMNGDAPGSIWTKDIHQVILGGETGHGARPMHPDWVRSVRDQCKAAGVPFFFKSWGTYKGLGDWDIPAGRLLDGREHNDLAWVTP